MHSPTHSHVHELAPIVVPKPVAQFVTVVEHFVGASPPHGQPCVLRHLPLARVHEGFTVPILDLQGARGVAGVGSRVLVTKPFTESQADHSCAGVGSVELWV